MKKHPKKNSRGRKKPHRPPLPTIGELLRVEFLERLGVTPEQIAAAIPPDPLDPGKSWVEEIRDLLGQETDEFLSVDVSLVLDRVFGFRDGSFLPLWATCAAHSRAKKRRPWLAKVQPLPVEHRLAAWRAPGGRGPDAAVSTHQRHDRAGKRLRSKRRNQRPAVTGKSSTATVSSHGRKNPKGHHS
jgi:plasmid maintenance system antidote protein VapI